MLVEASIFIYSLIVLDTIYVNSALATPSSNYDSVSASCKGKLKFQSIKDFGKFIANLRQIDGISSSDTSLKRCLNEKMSLLDLNELITRYDKKRPCKFEEISKLEKYARKYLLENKSPLALPFFTLFGVNIGFICKLNILAHIQQAELEVEQTDFIYSIATPSGWNVLINELTKKSIKFGVSSQANNVVNRVAKLIPGLVEIDQLNYIDFNHLTNENKIANWHGVEENSFEFENAKAAAKVEENLERIIESCKNLNKFYFNSLLSLAKLNHLGLLVNFKIDEYHEQSLTLHKWLAATSFCQLLVRVRIKESKEESSLNFEIIHDDSSLEDNERDLYSYGADLDEIRPEAIKEVWLANVKEGKWLQKSEALFQVARKEGKVSSAMDQLKQFLRGLELDYKSSLALNQ